MNDGDGLVEPGNCARCPFRATPVACQSITDTRLALGIR
jgi:hypothetical protein